MTETTANTLSVALFVAASVTYLLIWGWRKRQATGHGLALMPWPSEDWSDENVDRMMAALESPDRPTVYLAGDDLRGEHEGAFV